MADFLKDKRMEIAKRLTDFADESLEVHDRNKRYKPNRETDKYILDRLAENLPFQRPDTTDPRRKTAQKKHQQGPGHRYVERRQLFGDVAGKWSRPKTRGQLLEGWKDFEEDINALDEYGRNMWLPGGKQKYGPAKKAAEKRMDKSLGAINSFARQLVNVNPPWPEGLTPKEKQAVQDLQNALVEDMTTPGAQKDRPGRIQEIVEAFDLTNPDSGGRAALRELWRMTVDDRLPRIQAGYKTQTGEEALKDKLIEMELADTPRNRHAAMQALGWSGIPKAVQIKDDSGNPVPLYVDEMKADREAAAEKAYMQHRRDPMKDTPERDWWLTF